MRTRKMSAVSPETHQHDTHAAHVWIFIRYIVRLWERFQVELHGRFSIQRVERMREYAVHTGWLHLFLLGILTPVPALVVITLIDCIPLVSPDDGSNRNYAFWIRMSIVTTIIVGGNINHFQCCLPSLPMKTRELVCVAFAASTLVGVGFAYGLSHVIGFPVPFTLHVESIAGAPAAALTVAQFWRPVVRGNPTLQRGVRQLMKANFGKFTMLWVYPLYLATFTTMSPTHQSLFFFVLPMAKLVLKNYFSRVLYELDDCKPAFIVFNAELFNALYVANCLQSSHSWLNILFVMVVDMVQMSVSMYDIHMVMREVRSLVRLHEFEGSLLDLCMALASSSDVLVELDSSSMTLVRVSGMPRADRGRVKPAPPPRPPSVKNLSFVPGSQRGRLVSKIAKALYIAEFVLLIELVEVMIPVIYALYHGAMSHLPNRTFYPRLASLGTDKLSQSVAIVMLNAGLELVSFLVACWLVQRQLKTSSVHLLGFALESQRSLVQSSLIIWTTYVIQQSLVHTGVDFTLRFAWLRGKNEA